MSKNLIITFGAYALLLVLNIVVSKVVLISYGSEVNGLLASVNQVYTYIALLEAGIGTATVTALYAPLAKKNKDEIFLEINGRLDTTTAPALEKTINENLEGVKTLILDLKCLDYISSAGLRVLLSAQKKMQQIGAMKIINVCELVMEVFEMTGFADILTIE